MLSWSLSVNEESTPSPRSSLSYRVLFKSVSKPSISMPKPYASEMAELCEPMSVWRASRSSYVSALCRARPRLAKASGTTVPSLHTSAQR